MVYGTPPALGGVTLRRPTTATESPEPVRSVVTLAGGAERAYDRGSRQVFDLAWSRMTEAQLTALRALLRPTFTSYVHVDGATYFVQTAPPKVEPLGGTDPVRFSVSVQLREQAPR